MSTTATAPFDDLAKRDPTVAPLALLQAAALRAAVVPYWDATVPALDSNRLSRGIPILNGVTFIVEAERVRSLLLELAAVAARAGVTDAGSLQRALGAGDRRAPSQVDALVMLKAGIIGDQVTMAEAAERVGTDLSFLASMVHLASLPLLQACGRRVGNLPPSLVWEAGYCPVCAAWPLLAEVRGLERQRWLRCGRCGTGWRFRNQQCLYCDNLDHRTQGYLAPEGAHESRQALTCNHCMGYLKSFTTIRPLPMNDLLLKDLTTLELDIVALEQGYSRPSTPGFPLQLEVVPAETRSGWLPWRR